MIAKYQKRPKAEPIEYPDGPDGKQVLNLRTAEGRRIYQMRRHVMWTRQLGRCGTCKKRISEEEAEFGHGRAKGMGGANRDDRIWNADGTQKNAALCFECNRKQGSRHFEWRDGVFQAVERKT